MRYRWAEAFVRGDLEVEGDLSAVFPLANFVFARAHGASPVRRLMTAVLTGLRRVTYTINHAFAHSLRRDRRAISYHYDKPAEFFGPWLGPSMVYSCAYYCSEQETLEEAQWNKLDLICRKLRLQPGETMLDIGCGWGGLILHAARHYGVHSLGVTLSREQAAYAQRRIRELGMERMCEARLCDYRELAEGAEFDKIASVGMFEHVGRQNLGSYFASTRRLLRPGGAFLNHGIVEPSDESRKQGPTFIRKHVFPDAELATLPTVIDKASEAGFEVRDVECLREHYERTLHEWVGRLERRRRELLEHVDAETYRIWRLYMAGAAESFRQAELSIYQVLLFDPKGGDKRGPRTREDWTLSKSHLVQAS